PCVHRTYGPTGRSTNPGRTARPHEPGNKVRTLVPGGPTPVDRAKTHTTPPGRDQGPGSRRDRARLHAQHAPTQTAAGIEDPGPTDQRQPSPHRPRTRPTRPSSPATGRVAGAATPLAPRPRTGAHTPATRGPNTHGPEGTTMATTPHPSTLWE